MIGPATQETGASRVGAQALEGYDWILESATDGQNRSMEAVAPPAARRFVFSFSDSRLNIRGGCNRLSGSYRINAEKQLEVGRIASTMMACERDLMEADAAISSLLARPWQIELERGAQVRLRLVSVEKETLVLTGHATPETRYGAGTLMFLEVAARKIPCVNPFTSDKACLQARERHYDKQGIVVKTGEWRPLYEPIEGFTHLEGQRTVLRVKRFQRSAAPAGTSPIVYVLDLVVESETVAR